MIPRLFKHEQSGTIGMLQAGVRISDIARYHNCHPSTIQVLRDRYQATGTVKYRRRSGQPRITSCRPDNTLTAFFVMWHYNFDAIIILTHLVQNYRRGNFTYQHDNARAHTVRLTVNFLAANKILLLD